VKKVYWTPWVNIKKPRTDFQMNSFCIDYGIIYTEPVPLFTEVRENRTSEYLMCPAFKEFCKNTFVIKAPFDMTITIDQKNSIVNTSFNQLVYDLTTFSRGFQELDRFEKNKFLLTLPPAYIFYSDDDMEIESFSCPLSLDTLSPQQNFRVIPGRFNISKWIRALDFTIEIDKDVSEIKIKEGDILFCVRFIPKKDDKVVLERKSLSQNIINVFSACTAVKLFQRNLPLNRLYQIAEPFLNLYRRKKWFSKGKCPLDFSDK
jgi:hypothetical protein